MSKCPFHNLSKYDTDTLDVDKYVIVANDLHGSARQDIVQASVKREWMEETSNRYAYRCLPLNAANDLGWQLLCPAAVEMEWNGGTSPADIEVRCDCDVPFASSHFGEGVITFSLDYIFHTNKDQCLYVKGPTNHLKSSIQPLEGLIETDWLPFTFTMNWRIIEPNKVIRFEKDEPFCQFFPYPKIYIEKFDPVIRLCSKDTREMFDRYEESRLAFNQDLKDPNSEASKQKWQKYYFQGKYPGEDVKCQDLGFTHKTKSGAKPFVDERPKPKSVLRTI